MYNIINQVVVLLLPFSLCSYLALAWVPNRYQTLKYRQFPVLISLTHHPEPRYVDPWFLFGV